MSTERSVLCIVPLPPPITGAALAAKVSVNYLSTRGKVSIVAYQRGNLISGRFSILQGLWILRCGFKILFTRFKENQDSVYLLVSSTFWGNLRDLFFLAIMGKRLRTRATLHLQTSGWGRHLEGKSCVLKYLNQLLLKDVQAVIVLGKTFMETFKGYISSKKIKVVPNFVSKDILIPITTVDQKFESATKVEVVYMSNLMKDKGYDLLLDAFLSLPRNKQMNINMHFAGAISSEKDGEAFLRKISGNSSIHYYGVISGKQKRELLWNSHIFCLPTSYRYEGQPISIIEAYGAGCVVLTTKAGGIADIFENGVNGLLLSADPKFVAREVRVSEIAKLLDQLVSNIHAFKHMAIFNRREAIEKYSEERFVAQLDKIILDTK